MTTFHSSRIIGAEDPRTGVTSDGQIWIGGLVALESPVETQTGVHRTVWASAFSSSETRAKEAWNSWIESVKSGEPANVQVVESKVTDEESGTETLEVEVSIKISSVKIGHFGRA